MWTARYRRFRPSAIDFDRRRLIEGERRRRRRGRRQEQKYLAPAAISWFPCVVRHPRAILSPCVGRRNDATAPRRRLFEACRLEIEGGTRARRGPSAFCNRCRIPYHTEINSVRRYGPIRRALV
ncbi:hypothetical protein GW17_00006300 [Ensete ventricosum]|nr:hypothetical protein GW17_00006300 [Ensete ventricosum]